MHHFKFPDKGIVSFSMTMTQFKVTKLKANNNHICSREKQLDSSCCTVAKRTYFQLDMDINIMIMVYNIMVMDNYDDCYHNDVLLCMTKLRN